MSKSASWIIRDRITRAVLFETFDVRIPERLNTSKYEAVPILDYLQELNRTIKEGTK